MIFYQHSVPDGTAVSTPLIFYRHSVPDGTAVSTPLIFYQHSVSDATDGGFYACRVCEGTV
ncbi:MAG: hypothetical protein LBG31_03160 [Prevotellaceae bacterium]|nr:hypothetical protein [Prevotellaceae bacterium]